MKNMNHLKNTYLSSASKASQSMLSSHLTTEYLETWMANTENHDHISSSCSNLITWYHRRHGSNANATIKIIFMHIFAGIQGEHGNKSTYLLPVLSVPYLKTRLRNALLIHGILERDGTLGAISGLTAYSFDISLKMENVRSDGR